MELSILRLENLKLSYGKTEIIKDISLQFKQGRIQALIGPNGAGKSTTMRIISGLSIPSAGKAYLNGAALDHIDDIRTICGFLIESPAFHAYLSGIDNLKLLIQLGKSNQSAEELIKKVGLFEHRNKKFSTYSRGMKQRLGIAQALIGNPKFLVLDEPFHGLDPEVKLEFMQLFRQLANQGMGVLITSHLLSEIENIADDFVLLNKGEVFLDGKMTDYSGERQHVRLFFQRRVTLKNQPPFNITINLDQVDANLTRDETEQLITFLQHQDYIPFKIERSSILYDKYMEIASWLPLYVLSYLRF